MLWLCLDLPRLPLEALTADTQTAVAVVDRKGPRRWLIACSNACAAHAIETGLDVAVALARLPDLRLLDRSPKQELQALKGLAVWAEQFTSFASFDARRLCLWMEIGSVLQYFGGLNPLLARVRNGVATLAYGASLGIAPTPEAALLLARGEVAPVYNLEALSNALSAVPLACLPINPDWLASFAALGLRSVGELLQLPDDALARRYGPAVTAYLSRLLGRLPDPLQPYRPPPRYRRRFECFGAIESYEGLLFPLKRILIELEGFLKARDAAVQRLDLVFGHDRHPATRLEIRSTQPTRDAARLLLLVRERIERSVLAAAVEAITVVAKRLVPLGDTQLELLRDGAAHDAGWAALLDRLRARLGDAAVHRLGLQSVHRPEQAWCSVALDEKGSDDPTPDSRRVRPLWLMAPRELGKLPRLLGKPERIEAGWWDGNDVRRDYYLARTEEGARWWLFREEPSGRWFLQGLWA